LLALPQNDEKGSDPFLNKKKKGGSKKCNANKQCFVFYKNKGKEKIKKQPVGIN
jgi:hypothetical protein